MNCCDEYGDCRQGRDCPVRQACELPIQFVPTRRDKINAVVSSVWHTLFILAGVGLVAVLIAGVHQLGVL